MRLHRFYVGPEVELTHDFWLRDERLLHQWKNVLRMSRGSEVVLFNGLDHDRMYRIEELTPREVHLIHVTDFVRNMPDRDISLFWALLKRDKNDWVLQKGTELGVKHFTPLLTARTERTNFNLERSKKVVIEAVEQCGRSDIPSIREPMNLATAVDDYAEHLQLFVADQYTTNTSNKRVDFDQPAGVLIGPEGGWTKAELDYFKQKRIPSIQLGVFTLRAETAALAAITKLSTTKD